MYNPFKRTLSVSIVWERDNSFKQDIEVSITTETE